MTMRDGNIVGGLRNLCPASADARRATLPMMNEAPFTEQTHNRLGDFWAMSNPVEKFTTDHHGDRSQRRAENESRNIWPWVAVAAIVVAVAAADAEDPGSHSRNSNRIRARIGDPDRKSTLPPASLSQDGPLIREGELWRNELGNLLVSGQRYAFRPIRGGQSVVVLENLNLQRIVQRLGETSGAPVWSVSGVVTEFQGSNYLLIKRAVHKSRASLQAARHR